MALKHHFGQKIVQDGNMEVGRLAFFTDFSFLTLVLLIIIWGGAAGQIIFTFEANLDKIRCNSVIWEVRRHTFQH